MNFFIIIFLVILLGFSTRFFTTLFHELGHALAALLFQKGIVSIYIGTYGDPEKSFSFSAGRLRFFLRIDPVSWKYGLCVYQTDHSHWWKDFVITLAGPVASLILAFMCLMTLIFSESDEMKFVATFWFFSSLVDFLVNINPDPNPIILHNGKKARNDGYSLVEMTRYKKIRGEMSHLNKLIQDKHYREGAKKFREFYAHTYHPILLRTGIYLLLKTEDWKGAKIFSEELGKREKLLAGDFYNYGYALLNMQDYKNALHFIERAIGMKADHSGFLNGRGFVLLEMGKYEEAIKDFDSALEKDPAMAYAYNNRGLAWLNLDDREAAFKDISKSLELDDYNAYAYKNLGLYYVETCDFEKAVENFEKARSIKNDLPGIDDLLSKHREKTEESRSELFLEKNG